MSVPLALSLAALWVLVVFQGLVLIGLVRVVHQLQAAGTTSFGHGGIGNGVLLRGRDAPRFVALDTLGREVDSARLRAPLTAILFVSPTCESCTVTLGDMTDQLVRKTDGNVIVICRGGGEDCIQMAGLHHLAVPVVADDKLEISTRFEIPKVPFAVLVDDANRIVSHGEPMPGEDANEQLADDGHAGR